MITGKTSTGFSFAFSQDTVNDILYLEYTKNQQKNGQKNESRYFRQRTVERRKKIGSSGAKPKEP